jgi:hypothetical protein
MMAKVEMKASSSGMWLRKTVVNKDIPTKRAVKAVVTECWAAVCVKPEGAKFDTVVKAFNVDNHTEFTKLTEEETKQLKYVFYFSIPEFDSEVRSNPMAFSTHEKATLLKILKAVGMKVQDFTDTDQIIGKELEIMVAANLGEKGTKYYTIKEYFENEGVAWEE